MSKPPRSILDSIVEMEGDCLIDELCRRCPFKDQCHRQWLLRNRFPTRSQRLKMAVDAIAARELLNDDIEWRDTTA